MLRSPKLCQTQSDTCSLTCATATADQSVTLLENCASGWKKNRGKGERQETKVFSYFYPGVAQGEASGYGMSQQMG